MEAAGLYFRTPEEAALHINAIWGSVETWWESKQAIRKKLEALHAKADPWVIHWFSLLKNL